MAVKSNRTLRQNLAQQLGKRRHFDLGPRKILKNVPTQEAQEIILESLQNDLKLADFIGKALFIAALSFFGLIVLIWVGMSVWTFSIL